MKPARISDVFFNKLVCNAGGNWLAGGLSGADMLRVPNEAKEYRRLKAIFPLHKFFVALLHFNSLRFYPLGVISLVTISDFIKLGF